MRGRSFTLALVVASACREPATDRPRGEGCLNDACHGRVEEPHYGGAALRCVDCHGGNPDATTKEEAHVTVNASFNPSSPGGRASGGILTNPTIHDLDALSPAVMKFLNPADYRVVAQTCGSQTLGAGNCHTTFADNSALSTHATLAGQLAGGLYFGGLDDRTARFGVRAIADAYPSSHADGTVPSVTLFPSDTSPMAPSGDVARATYSTFGQLCLECHLGREGTKTPGKYYSSGCNACHLLTDDDGRPRTTDPTQDPEELGHGSKHRLTNLIPDSQCNHCHHAHLARGVLIQGAREKSEELGDTAPPFSGVNPGTPDPPNVEYWSQDHYSRYQGEYSLYGKLYPFYISDEDTTNDVDETPPDIHFEKGMACIDCHTMREAHGGEHLPERRDFEAQVRCESCHGAPGHPIDPSTYVDPNQALFVQALSRPGGTAQNEPTFVDGGDGLTLIGKLDGKAHPVTQIAERERRSEARFNPRTLMGCGLHSGDSTFRGELQAWIDSTPPEERAAMFPGLPVGGRLPADVWERPGRVECFTCHNAWTVNCYGCHIVRDDRACSPSMLDGACEPQVSTHAMTVKADALALGFNARGRVSPMVGTSIFFTEIGADGRKVIDAAPLQTVDGFSGDGNSHNPVHHHTTRRIPRDCDGCHPRADGGPFDREAFERALGYGTGRYTFTDGAGKVHLLDRLVALDVDGDGRPDDPRDKHVTGTVVDATPVASSTHLPVATGVAHDGPSPLDATTLNRMIGNRVVPQRTIPVPRR